MEAQLIPLMILVPFTGVFLYAGIQEYRRYKSEGSANYGLVYDDETGTTHVSAIADGEDAYDPDEFDPSNYNEPGTTTPPDDEKA